MGKDIDRAALFNSLSGAKTVEEIFAAIQAAPAADVQEIRRGRWVDDETAYICSVCFHSSPNGAKWNYCPNCGASMRGDEE